jgi:hypothetical protein
VANGDGQDFTKLLSKLIDLFKKLPLKKIGGSQAFDLFCDLMMIFAVWMGLRNGGLRADEKAVLVFICPGFVVLSFYFNRPIRRRTRR